MHNGLKGIDLTGLLGGGHKRRLGVCPPARSRSRALVGGLGDEPPRSLSFMCETTYNICIKIQQTTVVAVTG